MRRDGFTMVELIFVIVIIGTLSAVAIPKFTGVKDQARKSTELSTASAVATALEGVHSAWSIGEEDFDWDNDGLEDDIEAELSSFGYPLDLSRDSDPLGALLKSSSKSGFTEQTSGLMSYANVQFRLYTGGASDPQRGVPIPQDVASNDIADKPDRNDFWFYAPEVNATCTLSSDRFAARRIISGDFMLIDVNGTSPFNFNDISGANTNFTISCS